MPHDQRTFQNALTSLWCHNHAEYVSLVTKGSTIIPADRRLWPAASSYRSLIPGNSSLRSHLPLPLPFFKPHSFPKLYLFKLARDLTPKQAAHGTSRLRQHSHFPLLLFFLGSLLFPAELGSKMARVSLGNHCSVLAWVCSLVG